MSDPIPVHAPLIDRLTRRAAYRALYSRLSAEEIQGMNLIMNKLKEMYAYYHKEPYKDVLIQDT